MNKTEKTLIYTMKLIFFVLFTYFVLLYFGTLLILPLALVNLIINLFSFVFGNHSLFYLFIAVPTVYFIGRYCLTLPHIKSIILLPGISLLKMAEVQQQNFNQMLQPHKKILHYNLELEEQYGK